MSDQRWTAPGWYPDPMNPGHQREWDGTAWVGPAVPLGAQKGGGFPKWLIPVIACLGLGVRRSDRRCHRWQGGSDEHGGGGQHCHHRPGDRAVRPVQRRRVLRQRRPDRDLLQS